MPEECWNIFARLAGPQPPEFEAKLLKKSGDTDQGRQRGASRRRSSTELEGASWIVVVGHDQGAQAQRAPPFITSKLQQTARFPVKKTMMIAQQLYEGGIEIPELTGGLITYMRTDSVRVSDEARGRGREHIKTRVRRGVPAGERRTSTRRSRMRRTRTRRFARRRCSTIPKR